MTTGPDRQPLGRVSPGFVVLIVLLALAGCGGGGRATGPSVRAGRTSSDFDFGSNDPLVADAFGDSITQGELGDNTITSNNYPNILQSMLKGLDPAWRVINRGAPSDDVDRAVSRLPGVLAADHPGFVLVMEGTNNASHLDDPAFIAANLQAMVNQARANRTIPLVATIPPNFREFSNSASVRAVIDQANAMIRTMASVEGVVLAEVFNGMNTRSLFGQSPDADPLHPNEGGYAVMAGIWFTALQQALPAPGAPAPSPAGATSTATALRPNKRK